MPKRQIVLLGALALAYLAFASYITYQYPDQTDALVPFTFALFVVGVATISLRLEGRGRKRKGLWRALKILVASYAMAFAGWMLGSVLLLPVVGYAAFDLMESPMFFYLLLGAMVVLIPLVARRLT